MMLAIQREKEEEEEGRERELNRSKATEATDQVPRSAGQRVTEDEWAILESQGELAPPGRSFKEEEEEPRLDVLGHTKEHLEAIEDKQKSSANADEPPHAWSLGALDF